LRIADLAVAIALLFVAAAPAKDPRMLSCSPSVLTSRSVLTLHFALPHPAELSIQAPDGTSYLLVYDRGAAAIEQTPLVDKDSFRKMIKLKLRVSTAMGSPLVYGHDSNEFIFRKPGAYKVVLANVIQSDVIQDVYRCEVNLKSNR
jgi:hypothetical protein